MKQKCAYDTQCFMRRGKWVIARAFLVYTTYMPTVYDVNTAQQHRVFHSFCYRPNTRFEEQQDGEKVILVLRAHPITQIPWILTVLVLACIPLLVNVAIASSLSIVQILFLNIFWYGFVFSYGYLKILDWTFNVGIVTDRRVLDVDYNIIISREVTATTMDDIVDATSLSIGFLPSIFNYGHVTAQTPGTTQGIEFRSVPYPSEVVTIINRFMDNRGRHNHG